MLEVHVVEMMRELVETLKILISERRKRSPVPQLPESIVVFVKAVLKQRISERITAAHFPSKESVHELPQVQDVFDTTVHGASGASGSSGLLGQCRVESFRLRVLPTTQLSATVRTW